MPSIDQSFSGLSLVLRQSEEDRLRRLSEENRVASSLSKKNAQREAKEENDVKRKARLAQIQIAFEQHSGIGKADDRAAKIILQQEAYRLRNIAQDYQNTNKNAGEKSANERYCVRAAPCQTQPNALNMLQCLRYTPGKGQIIIASNRTVTVTA